MYVYTRVCICIYIYICIYVYTHTYIHTHTCTTMLCSITSKQTNKQTNKHEEPPLRRGDAGPEARRPALPGGGPCRQEGAAVALHAHGARLGLGSLRCISKSWEEGKTHSIRSVGCPSFGLDRFRITNIIRGSLHIIACQFSPASRQGQDEHLCCCLTKVP